MIFFEIIKYVNVALCGLLAVFAVVSLVRSFIDFADFVNDPRWDFIFEKEQKEKKRRLKRKK